MPTVTEPQLAGTTTGWLQSQMVCTKRVSRVNKLAARKAGEMKCFFFSGTVCCKYDHIANTVLHQGSLFDEMEWKSVFMGERTKEEESRTVR